MTRSFNLSKFIYIGEDDERLIWSCVVEGESAIEILKGYALADFLAEKDSNGKFKFHHEENYISGDNDFAKLFLNSCCDPGYITINLIRETKPKIHKNIRKKG